MCVQKKKKSATGTGPSSSQKLGLGRTTSVHGKSQKSPLFNTPLLRTTSSVNSSSRGAAAAPSLSSDPRRLAGTSQENRPQPTLGSTGTSRTTTIGPQKPMASTPRQVERPAAGVPTATAGQSKPTATGSSSRRRGVSPGPGHTNGTVVAFNPRVKAVPPESDNDPPPPPRPPSRNTRPPARSALKTPPPASDKILHTPIDHPSLDDITQINTHRNRATPKPPSPSDAN
ncbi:hypothetical protein VP01_1250g6 [Puccinia sorghi]|uniref:Uncharacterized protein n=1 Tax=Puccinia sorghi TaxID=27349 RepID=A0A0L6VPF3_9BASI|nr:hypothetical protein VP01_1250g6 [Puccinia sorghi]